MKLRRRTSWVTIWGIAMVIRSVPASDTKCQRNTARLTHRLERVHHYSVHKRTGESWRRWKQEKRRCSGATFSGQSVEQGLGLLQRWGLKPFGEPTINRGQHVTRFVWLALPLPETSKTSCGT